MMKKISILMLFTGLMGLLVNSQNLPVTEGVYMEGISLKADFSCPGSSVFSYPSVGSDGGNTSDETFGYRCYQSYSAASEAFSSVTVWAWHDAPASTRELRVEIYEPGPFPTTLVSSTLAMVDPINTGVTQFGFIIYSYTIDIPVVNNLDGWVAVIATAGGGPVFYWQNTHATPAYPAVQIPGGSYLGTGLAMCLGEVPAPPTVPLSNWAFALIGIFAVTLVVFKFRK